MATVKKGILTSSGEWWKHLRWTKRAFWKAERRAAEREAVSEVGDEFDKSLATSNKGGILAALLRSPLVGSNIDLTREVTYGREVDL